MKKQEIMYAKVEQWQQSQMSKEEYAAAHGLSYHTFTKWCRRYNQEKLLLQNPAPKFVEIQSKSNPEENSVPHPERLAKIDIELPGGIHIKIY
jgi:transposase-like protein